MAKDPAMLWYWSDWHSGTVLMSRFLKGCYMDLLHAEFNNGRLSLEEIKTCLGSDFGSSWPAIQKKFKQDENGMFFNEKLEFEQNKRKAFTESRRQSRMGKKDNIRGTYEERTIPRTENENRNVNELEEIEYSNTVEYCSITLHRKYSIDRIKELFKAFCIQHEKTPYTSKAEKVKHFRNWIKTQPFEEHKQSTIKKTVEAIKHEHLRQNTTPGH